MQNPVYHRAAADIEPHLRHHRQRQHRRNPPVPAISLHRAHREHLPRCPLIIQTPVRRHITRARYHGHTHLFLL